MLSGHSAESVDSLKNVLFVMLIILISYISVNIPVCQCQAISPERCRIWGPGLNPDAVVPVRYFFIQAVNSKGENLTLSPGKGLHPVVAQIVITM